MIKEATQKLTQKIDLAPDQMQVVMEEIMGGSAATPDIVSFLVALHEKGETKEEIAATARVMLSHAVKIKVDKDIILDTCGTGGDKKGTLNVSTIVAFVVAGCGVTVAKHGNRSVSSSCGSADILEALGINVNLPKETIEKSLNDIGIAFMFAPNMHPAMKYAMPARKQIGQRTIFNIMGPLCNPAHATHQLVGVFESSLSSTLAKVLGDLGIVHALVVHGKDGLDEITTTDRTIVAEYSGGKIDNYEIAPEDFGFKRVDPEDLLGGSIQENAQILLEILNGKPGPKRDIVVLNAAAALYAADKVGSIKAGIVPAIESIDSRAALKKLALLKEYSRAN